MEDINLKQTNFHKNSYERHAHWYNRKYPEYEQKVAVLESIKNYQGSINHWLQEVFFSCLIPLISDKKSSWLTIGDAYGHDAHYLRNNQVNDVLATDLNDDFLAVSKDMGLIEHYAVENAENLSLCDETVDYVLCKESYHHFPRPYAALYEMLRVAKKGIIIIEPQDPILKMPILLFISNILNRIQDGLTNKVWKNRFSYEVVGNFVYKISEREFEKLAAGLNLPLIAIKPINPNFWFPESHKEPASLTNKKFSNIRRKKKFRDLLCRWGIVPSQTLSIVIFKVLPDDNTKQELKNGGYKLVQIPKNPYI